MNLLQGPKSVYNNDDYMMYVEDNYDDDASEGGGEDDVVDDVENEGVDKATEDEFEDK